MGGEDRLYDVRACAGTGPGGGADIYGSGPPGVDTKLFHLGHNNPVAALSKLTGSVANGVLQVTNGSTANTTQNATAIGATNNSKTSPAMRATNAGFGTALELNVTCNPLGTGCFKPPPMKVNSDTQVAHLNSDELDGKDSSEFAGGVNGVATNADRIDGKDSEEILPLVRAQKDPNQGVSSNPQTSSPVDINTVSITAPTNGILVIWGSTAVGNQSTGTQTFLVSPKVDGNLTASRAFLSIVGSSTSEHTATNTAVPVSAGAHTVTLNVEMTSGSGAWNYNRHNLAVMFVPAERGAVTDAAN